MVRSSEAHRLTLVRRLLSGGQVDSAQLGYELEGVWHLGLLARGQSAGRTLTGIAAQLGLRALVCACEERCVWAWISAGRALPVHEIEAELNEPAADASHFALGAPRRGLAGFRDTHVLASAAYSVAQYRADRVTRCVDVAPAAALAGNEALASLLIEHYLTPLEGLRMGGDIARRTLAAYCACEGNLASAAARLGVGRRTFEYRLQAIGERLGRPPKLLISSIAVALQVEAALGGAAAASGANSDLHQ